MNERSTHEYRRRIRLWVGPGVVGRVETARRVAAGLGYGIHVANRSQNVPGRGRGRFFSSFHNFKEEKGQERVPKAAQGWGQEADGPWRVFV